MSFLRENNKIDNYGESLILTKSPYTLVSKFQENTLLRNDDSRGNRENHTQDEFVKIQELTYVIVFCDSPSKMRI